MTTETVNDGDSLNARVSGYASRAAGLARDVMYGVAKATVLTAGGLVLLSSLSSPVLASPPEKRLYVEAAPGQVELMPGQVASEPVQVEAMPGQIAAAPALETIVQSHAMRVETGGRSGDYIADCETTGSQMDCQVIVPSSVKPALVRRLRERLGDDVVFEGNALSPVFINTDAGTAQIGWPELSNLVFPSGYSVLAKAGSVGFTTAQVAANREQIRLLAERMLLVPGPNSQGPQTLGEGYPMGVVLTFANACGDIIGQARNDQFTRSGDIPFVDGQFPYSRLLMFNLSQGLSSLSSDVNTAPVLRVGLARDGRNSDYVANGDEFLYSIQINPLAEGTPGATDYLSINNRNPGGTGSSVRPRDGLTSVLASPHCLHSDADVLVYQIMAKLAQGRSCTNFLSTENPENCNYTFVGVVRDRTQDNYIIDMWTRDPSGNALGFASAKLAITYDGNGHFYRGNLVLDQGATQMNGMDYTIAILQPFGSGELASVTGGGCSVGQTQSAEFNSDVCEFDLLLPTYWQP